MKIKTNNPYFDKTYETDEHSVSDWKVFIENYRRGNENIFVFTDITSRDLVSINPANFASVEVSE
ncbi:hypothetical protein [Enterococcus sp. LJL90]